MELEESAGNPSEMSQLRNLHWWTVEYGLIGNLDSPKIYGAGLLSSIGESFSAMQTDVKKIPYSIEAMHYGFDITKTQPQLFVTPDFEYLNVVLEQFSEQMALKKGGAESILKAIESNHIATCELSSGLQISGVFTEAILDGPDLIYIKTTGPTELGYNNESIPDHGKDYHKDGYGTPIGKLKNCNKPIRFLQTIDLERLSIQVGKLSKLKFLSGLKIEGKLINIVRKEGNILLMSFEECTVRYKGKTLFMPEWGVFDMAVGEQVISAYNGNFHPEYSEPDDLYGNSKIFQRTENPISERINILYKQVREWRENGAVLQDLSSLIQEISQLNNKDWLLPFEWLELARKTQDFENERKVHDYLDSMPETCHHLFQKS